MGKPAGIENWDDFRYFLAVVRAGTLSGAANKLRTDHATVARHVRSLEEAIHQQLFLRSHRGYELTAAGELLRGAAEALESTLVTATAATDNGANGINGTVRVAAPDGFGSLYLAPRLAELTRCHPRIEIELLAMARMFSLSEREADIAIALSRPDHVRVTSRKLVDYRSFLYASRSYLQQSSPILEQQDLKGHHFISYVEELVFTPQLNYLSILGGEIEARIRSTNLLAQVQATLSGSGLCILPAFIGSLYADLVPVLADEISITHTLHIHVHEDHRHTPHVREVGNFIAAHVAKDKHIFTASGSH
jgi:DNA-binding transcriptional LysR family regulator